jgi:hypothetical protein
VSGYLYKGRSFSAPYLSIPSCWTANFSNAGFFLLPFSLLISDISLFFRTPSALPLGCEGFSYWFLLPFIFIFISLFKFFFNGLTFPAIFLDIQTKKVIANLVDLHKPSSLALSPLEDVMTGTQAVFNSSDDLVLHGTALWDVRNV